MNIKKIMSFVLSLVLAFLASSGLSAASAEEQSVLLLKDLPDVIDELEAIENKYIKRMPEMENDLFTLAFNCEDGTNTLRLFSHPVKYLNESGEIKDITLDITEEYDGGFVTKDNEIRSRFPSDLSEGISFEFRDINLKMTPFFENSEFQIKSMKGTLSLDSKKVLYSLNDSTKIDYALTYAGFKENIVLTEYNGICRYDFLVETNGLSLVQDEDGEVFLCDIEGVARANIGNVVVITANGEVSSGLFDLEIISENELYKLTIVISEEFLKDPATTYPVIIDPTIEVNYSVYGSGAIEDVTLNSNAGSSPSSKSLSVGKRATYGKSRVLMRFSGLNLGLISRGAMVNSAYVKLYDLNQESASMTVYCYTYSDILWDSYDINWSYMSDSYIGSLLDQKIISHSEGQLQSPVNWYSFNITNAVRSWKDGDLDLLGGIIFRASDGVETSSTNLSKTFASFDRASYKPSLTVNFTLDSMYSGSGDLWFYENETWNDYLQYRANCYGYALRIFGSSLDCYNYSLIPGEFAAKPLTVNNNTITNYGSLKNTYRSMTYNNGQPNNGLPANFVVDLVNADLNAINSSFSVLSRPTYYYADSIPNASQYTDRRLILVVTMSYEDYNYGEYHFYMQNSDNTWSHKQGMGPATNISISGNVVLTNNNILSHFSDGDYSYDYQFFYINKPTTIDFRHLSGNYNECVSTPLDFADLAGNTISRAKDLGINTFDFTGRYDYLDDEDYFMIKVSSSASYYITILSTTSGITPAPTFELSLYDKRGVRLSYLTTSTNDFLINYLNAGDVYYLKVTVTNSYMEFYNNITYSIDILDD